MKISVAVCRMPNRSCRVIPDCSEKCKLKIEVVRLTEQHSGIDRPVDYSHHAFEDMRREDPPTPQEYDVEKQEDK